MKQSKAWMANSKVLHNQKVHNAAYLHHSGAHRTRGKNVFIFLVENPDKFWPQQSASKRARNVSGPNLECSSGESAIFKELPNPQGRGAGCELTRTKRHSAQRMSIFCRCWSRAP